MFLWDMTSASVRYSNLTALVSASVNRNRWQHRRLGRTFGSVANRERCNDGTMELTKHGLKQRPDHAGEYPAC
ncbi:MAG: hypothetical protein JW829_09120, partial [Pirellulales bacterium]|nr:hypothetical protein [Pirellulales bacterium]